MKQRPPILRLPRKETSNRSSIPRTTIILDLFPWMTMLDVYYWEFPHILLPAMHRTATADDRTISVLKAKWHTTVDPRVAELSSPVAFIGLGGGTLIVVADIPPASAMLKIQTRPYPLAELIHSINTTIAPHIVDEVRVVKNLEGLLRPS